MIRKEVWCSYRTTTRGFVKIPGRFYSKSAFGPNDDKDKLKSDQPDQPEQPDDGYMLRRLGQLAEESSPFKDDPNAGRSMDLDAIYARAESDKFKYVHQKDLVHTKIPSYAPKQAREIAQSAPWTGTESVYDVNLRMLVDAHPVPRVVRPPTLKKVSRSERLSNARENSLNYALDKNQEGGPSAGDIYKDKFAGSSGIPLLHTSLSAINSLASQRIEDAIARGEFNDLPRGKPLERDYYASSPYIDTTEYFLNRLIKRQGAAPPWVEKQVTLNAHIKQFRNIMSQKWQKRAVNLIVSHRLPLSRSLELAERYRSGETTGYRLRDLEWEKQEQKYHELAVADINNTIRGYNLQAPSSARRGYVELSKELELCYRTVAKDLPEAVRQHMAGPVPPEREITSASNLHRTEPYKEDPSNHYGLMDLFRDILRRRG
jgi:DnaJ family protein C protein 28